MRKSLKHSSFIRATILVTLALLIALASMIWSNIENSWHPLNHNRHFTQHKLGETYDLFDVGVVDVNSDNFLDVFTVNHSARQRLLINESSLQFTDQLISRGLSQNLEFPGSEPSNIAPSINEPGLYIYWDKANLVIRTHDTKRIGSLNFSVQLADWVKPDSSVIRTEGSLKVKQSNSSGKLVLNISADGEGQLVLSSRQYTSINCFFNLSETFPLEKVNIGPERIRPNSRNFNLVAGRDRHGMAWANFLGDKQIDVFIARGGASGTMKLNSTGDQDELLNQKSSLFNNVTSTSGLVKQACPARQVASVDFNQDDELDLYLVCGRGRPPRQEFPNQLHQKTKEGVYQDVAHDKGLDISNEGLGKFLWFDADDDGDMDLLWASQNNEFWLYTNTYGQFKPEFIGKNNGTVKQLTIADYDNDGVLEVFSASPQGNTLIVNTNGTYSTIKPASLGLPSESATANWVDFDNDGLMDLHVLPDGLYRQRSDHTFKATHLLKSKRVSGKAFSTWFDADNDGLRDLLVAIEEPALFWLPSPLERVWNKFFAQYSQGFDLKTLSRSKLILYHNRHAGLKAHWLQLQLVGNPGNQQAIGAKVQLSTPNGLQKYQIGQADGSINSQGHYRLYIGLGKSREVNAMHITWPDGTLSELKGVDGDRLLSIDQVKDDTA